MTRRAERLSLRTCLLAICTLLAIVGCAHVGQPIVFGDEGYAETVAGAEAAGGACSEGVDIKLVKPKERRGQMLTNIRLCGREFDCALSVNRSKDIEGPGDCRETPSSAEKTMKVVVVDRLALETGCPAAQIEIISATEWRRGTERGFRLAACGKSYVCTTAAGRTDCKAALDQAAPPPSPPVEPASGATSL